MPDFGQRKEAGKELWHVIMVEGDTVVIDSEEAETVNDNLLFHPTRRFDGLELPL